MGAKSSKSSVQFFPGQKNAIASNVFNQGGIFDQFLAGAPSTGLERAQNVGVQTINRQFEQQGTAGTPLQTRAQLDFLNRSTQAQDDNFMQRLFGFMQPAGSQGTGGKPGFTAQMFGKG
jgi:hypothetical protein